MEPLPPPATHFLPHQQQNHDPYADAGLIDSNFVVPDQRREYFDSPLAPLQHSLMEMGVPQLVPYNDVHGDRAPLRSVRDITSRQEALPQPVVQNRNLLPQMPPQQPALAPQITTRTNDQATFGLIPNDVAPAPVNVDDRCQPQQYLTPVIGPVPQAFGMESATAGPAVGFVQNGGIAQIQGTNANGYGLNPYQQNPVNIIPVGYTVGSVPQQPYAHVQTIHDDGTISTSLAYVTHPVQVQNNPVLLNPLQTGVEHLSQTILPGPDMGIHPLANGGGNVVGGSSMMMNGHGAPVLVNSGTGVDIVSGSGLFPVGSEQVEMVLNLGKACRDLGRPDLATIVFKACISYCPESADARACYASSVFAQGYPDPPPEYGHMLAEDVINDVGNSLRGMGRVSEAELAYRTVLRISPRHAHALNNLGNALRARSDIAGAIKCYITALTYQPVFAAAHCNLGGLLRDQGKPQEAESNYRAALMSEPNMAEAAAGLGTALRDMGRTEEAVDFYIRAVNLQPEASDHHANLANTYKDLNRIEESIVSYRAALSLQPDLPDAFCNMVHSLSVICDWKNRSENFATLLTIIDRQLDTLMNHPTTSSRLYCTLVGALSNSTPQLVDACGGSRSDRDSASVSATTHREENSNDVKPRRKYIPHPTSPTIVKRAKARGNFARFITDSATVVAPVLTTGLPSVQPFHALIYPMSPEKFKALAAAYAARAEAMVNAVEKATQVWVPPKSERARLKVGYVSSDYNNHPYSHLTQSIYGLHRQGHTVECYCYALTPSDGSTWRHRIESEVEHFRDISSMTPKQSADAIAMDGIHVLVNCNGYTKGARTELFALRPAPVQVSFMGFPGTLGAHFIEYFITDVVTSPPELSARMHSEALLYHPHSYFVNDHKQTSCPGPASFPGVPGGLTRAHYGLPQDCFLFIMHNQLYKLSPDTFDVWARILKRVPNSKLWLLRFPPSGEQRIREEAIRRGLGPDRLIFTDVAGKEEHVARAGLGDLFLDTPTCNAHTTGTDVLWSGVPMVTCPGSLFASRVAASLLTAAGVPELIAKDMREYEELAVDLATNRKKLAAIRSKIESSRRTNALFDTERWVRNVEALYWRAWKNFEDGNPPTHIYGRDVYDGSTMMSPRPSNIENRSTTDSRYSETLIQGGSAYNSTIAT